MMKLMNTTKLYLMITRIALPVQLSGVSIYYVHHEQQHLFALHLFCIWIHTWRFSRLLAPDEPHNIATIASSVSIDGAWEASASCVLLVCGCIRRGWSGSPAQQATPSPGAPKTIKMARRAGMSSNLAARSCWVIDDGHT